MESYHKKKRLLEEKYGKLIVVAPHNYDIVDKNPIVSHRQQKLLKQLRDITDEEGLKRAYDAKDGLYQHYNKLFIAGTKDPIDFVDDLKLPFNDTLNLTTRGRTADKYYRSHHELDTVIGHSLGGSVSLALEKKYKKQGDNPYGILQSKTYGAPVLSGNVLGEKNPNRIRYFGDPISALDFNSTTVYPSFKTRWKQSAHSYAGLEIADKIPLHDVEKNMLEQSPDDSKAEIITA
jgi:hypothetical protein